MSSLALWLADYHLLATALLLGVMLAVALLRQPAQRMAVAKSTLAALFALALLCALPGWSLVHLMSEPTPNSHVAPATASMTPIDPPVALQSDWESIERPPVTPMPTTATQTSSPSSPTAEPRMPIDWTVWLLAAYAAGSAAVTLWLIVGALLAGRVRRQATLAPSEFQELLRQVCGDSKPVPQLLISPRIAAPAALGLRHPAIILPAPSAPPFPIQHSTFSILPSQLLPILAHEWAHLEHRDLHTLAASRLLLILLWPQPLFWLLRRTIRLDQETLADAAAADHAGRLDYAQQLLAWARTANTQRPPRLAGAVGLWEGPSQLKRRIALLLNEQFAVMRSCSAAWRRLCIASLAVAAVALSLVTLQPSPAVGEDEPSPSPVASEAVNATDPVEVADDTTPPASKAELPPNATAVHDTPTDGITRHQSIGMGAFALVPLKPAEPSTENANKLEINVIDEQGGPLAGVEALIYRAAPHNAPGTPVLLRTLATDAAGKLLVPDLVSAADVARFQKIKADGGFLGGLEGGYLIALRRPGLATAAIFQAAGPLALYGANRTIKMHPGVKLSGQVTDPAGQPVAGAKVIAGGDLFGGFAIEGVNAAVTDADGRYEFADRAAFKRAEANKQQNQFLTASLSVAGEPTPSGPPEPEDPSVNSVSDLLVSHPDYAFTRIEGGDVPGGVDVKLLPSTSIAGRVIHHGSAAPAAGVIVHADEYPEARQIGMEMEFRPHHSAVTTTDATGAYRFSNLPASRYDVWADSGAKEMSDASWVSRGYGRIEASPGSEPVQVPDLVIGAPAVVQVQLVDAESGKPIELPAGAKVTVGAESIAGPRLQIIPQQRAAASTDGRFDMRLLPGQTRVFLFVHEGGLGSRAIWQTDDDVHATGKVFDVKFGETSSATIPVLPTRRAEELRERDMAANKLMEEKKYVEAIAAYTALIADFPKNHFRVLQQRGHAYNRVGDYAAALADFEASLKLAPEDAGIKYMIAGLLATTPIDADRDSRRALEYAEQLAAFARTQDNSQHWLASILNIQAAAHADLGDFDKAIKIEQEAIELSHKSQREGMESRLKLYQQKKPYRLSPPTP